MSQYNVFLKRLSGLKGDISRERVNINAEIRPENKKRNLSFSIPAKYGIKFVNSTVFFGAVKKINAIYRFISSKSELIMGHKAKPNTAPAKLVEVDSTIQAIKAAPLVAHPVKEISADQKERLSVYAKLSAYQRAGCRYIKQLYFKRKAKLQADPGAVAKYTKAVKLERISKAIASESAITESRFNTIEHSYEAAGGSAPAQDIPSVETVFTSDSTATAGQAAAVVVSAQTAPGTASSAKMATWLEPVVVDGVLILRQAYTATVENGILVVR